MSGTITPLSWGARLWVVALSGWLGLLVSVIVYSPMFLLTYFADVEGYYSFANHSGRLIGQLAELYIPLGLCCGVLLLLTRFSYRHYGGLSLWKVILAGVMGGAFYIRGFVLQLPSEWFVAAKSNLIDMTNAVGYWSIIAAFFGLLITSLMWLCRHYVFLGDL